MSARGRDDPPAPGPAPGDPSWRAPDVAQPAAVLVEGVAKGFRRRLHPPGAATLKGALLDLARLRRRAPEVAVEALADVSFAVAPGEALAAIGRNGAGKSTLLRLVAGALRPDRGRVAVRGRVGRLLDPGGGFHPDLTGRENAEVALLAAGLSGREARRALPEVLAWAGVEDLADAPVRTWSAGQVVRLGFAAATGADPRVLVVDEVIAVGDLEFQARCRARIADLLARGAALVLASHDLAVVEATCARALWLERGRPAALGPAADVCRAYLERLAPPPT